MKVYSLFSGSSANCILVKGRRGSILIDAGGSVKKIRSALAALNMTPQDISAIFVTHEHTDHVKALPMISKKYAIPIHMTEKSAEFFVQTEDDAGICPIKCHTPIFGEEVCGMKITSFPTSHDSVCCIGYTIEEDGEKIGIATDTGTVTAEMETAMRGSRGVLIEANYDRDMLRGGIYPARLKARISGARGHLCNDDCAAFALRLAESGTKSFLLCHLSAENNRPELARDAVMSALLEGGFRNIRVSAADRNSVSELADNTEASDFSDFCPADLKGGF